jgi:lipooligosaccharide transport system ATP-binding protein
MYSDDNALIRARALTKRFGAFTAVDGISFDVHAGEAFGFLGPNGAGKTSTMRMIACASPASGGELRVLSMNPQSHASRIKARLGVVPQQDNLDTEITVRENLLMYARYFDIPRHVAEARADELLEFVELRDRAGAQVEPLSGGMKRRLTIARALVNEPDLILLDEPTTGLDPQARHVVWERLYQLKRRGATLLLTTHYMDEAERLCDRLVVMDKAKIVAEGSPRELIAQHSTREVLELRFPDDVWPSSHSAEPLASARQAVEGRLSGIGDRVEVLPDRVQVYTADGEHALQQVHALGIPLESAVVRRSTLEDVFLRITGRALIE